MGKSRQKKNRKHRLKKSKSLTKKNKVNAIKRKKSNVLTVEKYSRDIPQMALYEMQSPFQGLNNSERDREIIKISVESQKKLDKSLSELQQIIKSIDPSTLIACLSLYFLTSPEKEYKSDYEYEVHQHQVELLQALSLQYSYEDMNDWKLLQSEDIEKVRTLLTDISNAFSFMRLENLVGLKDKESKQFLILEQIRNHTMMVRNWAYPAQIIKTVKEIFKPIENDFQAQTSLKIEYIMDMFLNVTKLIEDRINSYIENIQLVLKSNSTEGMVEHYLNMNPDIITTKKELITLSEKFQSRLDFAYFLIEHSNLFVSQIFSLTLKDFVDCYPIPDVNITSLENVIGSLAYKAGDLKEYKTEFIFLANPVWNKPIIKEANDYYFPIPGLLLEYSVKMMENVIRPYELIFKKYQNNRGKVLERKLKKLFQSAFKDAAIHTESIWKDSASGKEFENDLLIVVDRYAIVVEAKGGSITDTAKRGASKRLKREVQELLIEPSIQAKRFAEYLNEYKGQELILNSKSGSNKINLSQVEDIITLGVTIELFGMIGNNQKELYEAGFIDELNVISPSIPINDLEIVFDTLGTSSEKIHYLIRREQFEKNADYIGDELDLLAFYLHTGFNIGEAEFDSSVLQLGNSSEIIDPYFSNLFSISESKKRIKKPTPRRTNWWQEIIDWLEYNKTPGWTIMSQTLLNLSFEDQLQFEKNFKTAKMNCKKGFKDTVVVMGVGPEQRRSILIGIAYRNLTREERKDLINSIASEVLQTQNQKLATVICFDIDKEYQPYNVLGLVKLNNVTKLE